MVRVQRSIIPAELYVCKPGESAGISSSGVFISRTPTKEAEG